MKSIYMVVYSSGLLLLIAVEWPFGENTILSQSASDG